MGSHLNSEMRGDTGVNIHRLETHPFVHVLDGRADSHAMARSRFVWARSWHNYGRVLGHAGRMGRVDDTHRQGRAISRRPTAPRGLHPAVCSCMGQRRYCVRDRVVDTEEPTMRTRMTMPPMQQSCVRSECRGIFTILSHRLAVMTTWSMKAADINAWRL